MVMKTKTKHKSTVFCSANIDDLLALKHIKHSVVNTSKSIEEKCVSKTMKDATEISKVS